MLIEGQPDWHLIPAFFGWLAYTTFIFWLGSGAWLNSNRM